MLEIKITVWVNGRSWTLFQRSDCDADHSPGVIRGKIDAALHSLLADISDRSLTEVIKNVEKGGEK